MPRTFIACVLIAFAWMGLFYLWGRSFLTFIHAKHDTARKLVLGYLVLQVIYQSSCAAWQDRNLTWGTGTSYIPDETTSQWMKIVYEENSPVVEVLAGHLHLTWDGMISETVHEHVFSPGFSQYVGLITVDGNV